MHKSATKYNETLGKWCKNKHGASKIMDTLETYHVLYIAFINIDQPTIYFYFTCKIINIYHGISLN
jgi:hypothetical protein